MTIPEVVTTNLLSVSSQSKCSISTSHFDISYRAARSTVDVPMATV